VCVYHVGALRRASARLRASLCLREAPVAGLNYLWRQNRGTAHPSTTVRNTTKGLECTIFFTPDQGRRTGNRNFLKEHEANLLSWVFRGVSDPYATCGGSRSNLDSINIRSALECSGFVVDTLVLSRGPSALQTPNVECASEFKIDVQLIMITWQRDEFRPTHADILLACDQRFAHRIMYIFPSH